MMQQDQIIHLNTLGLDVEKVTDLNERKEAEAQLKKSGQWPQHAAKFKATPLEIMDINAVKKAWRKKCMEFHPDKFDQKAYQQYIDDLKSSTKNVEECETEPVISKEDMENMFREVTHAYKMLTDPSYANKFRNKHFGGQKVLDAVFNLTVDFDQAFFGDYVSITFNPVHIDDSGKPVKIDKEKDVYLKGEVIKIRIKEGMVTGDQIKISNKGLCQGDRRGNMVITIQVVPHPRLRVQGSDVVDMAEIPLDMMLTGGEVDVITMWGTDKLRVPAGSRPNDKLEIKNRGVSKVGNHVVTITPLYPDKDELQEKKVWKKLGINWKTEEDKDDQEAKDDQEYQTIFSNLGGFTFTSSSSGSSTAGWGA